MSFCSQCGNELPSKSNFCPSCGSKQGVAKGSPQPSSAQKPSAAGLPVTQGPNSSKAAKRVGVIDVVLIALTFFPWVSVDLTIWSKSYSLPGLIGAANSFQGWASSLLGSSYSSSAESTAMVVVFLAVFAAWLAAVVLLARDAYRCLSGRARKLPTAGPSVLIALASMTWLVLFMMNQAIGEGSGYSVSMLSTAPWLQVSLVLAVGLLLYIGIEDGHTVDAD